MREFINDLLTIPDANSRMVYAIQGVVTAIITLGVGIAYIFAHDASSREGFSSVLMILLGGGSLGAVARGIAKKTGSS